MKKFDHIIFTRFNVRFSWINKDKAGRRVLTDEWLKSRIWLFESICLPSMQNQSEQDFRWIVLFDESSSDELRNKTRIYEGSFPNFVSVFTTEERINADCSQVLDPEVGHAITTRLDSDDALQKDAVGRIQEAFERQSFEFINLSMGYVLDVETGELYSREEESNPFISLIEEKTEKPFVTIIGCGDHSKLSQKGAISNITDNRYWLRGIHNINVANSEFGNSRASADLSDFNLKCL